MGLKQMLIIIVAFVGVLNGRDLRKRTACVYDGQELEVGETIGEGCDQCTCHEGGGLACIKKRSCAGEVENMAMCSHNGEILMEGDTVGEGAHQCTCTDTGYMMCGRSIVRKQVSDSCTMPDGRNLEVGSEGVSHPGQDDCARCDCILTVEGFPALACASCHPPVQMTAPPPICLFEPC